MLFTGEIKLIIIQMQEPQADQCFFVSRWSGILGVTVGMQHYTSNLWCIALYRWSSVLLNKTWEGWNYLTFQKYDLNYRMKSDKVLTNLHIKIRFKGFCGLTDAKRSIYEHIRVQNREDVEQWLDNVNVCVSSGDIRVWNILAYLAFLYPTIWLYGQL